MSAVKNVALVGASGNLGGSFLRGLLANSKHTITAITRTDSTAKFPDAVKIAKGDYESKAFFVDALKGQDAVVITMPFGADALLQTRIIEAAAEAGVPYVIPNEYGSDSGNDTMRDAVPATASKAAYLRQVEALGKSSWIGVITNPWFDYCLENGILGINLKERHARFFDDGNTKINTTTFARSGVSLAKLLSLPEAQLKEFKNHFVYFSSFQITQNELLASVQRVTGTTPKDWTVEYVASEQVIKDSWVKVNAGEFGAMINLMAGNYFKPGNGGDYEAKTVNKLLGLGQEDLDTVVKGLI